MSELLKAVSVTAELTGTPMSETAAEVLVTELAPYPMNQVLGALKRCRKELRPRMFTMAAVLERLDDGRPGPEEGWAMLPVSEDQTVVWTTEMASAWRVALPLMQDGDMVAARMTFKETYLKLVMAARDRGDPVRWAVCLGMSKAGQEGPLIEAVRAGRITLENAKSECLAMTQGSEAVLRLEHTEALERIGSAVQSIGGTTP